jgi:hypothetical protein
MFIKSTVVYSNVPGLHIHSLTHPEQLPDLQAPFMVSAPYRCINFYLLFLCTFSMFRYTRTVLTIVLQLPTVFSTVRCCTGL